MFDQNTRCDRFRTYLVSPASTVFAIAMAFVAFYLLQVWFTDISRGLVEAIIPASNGSVVLAESLDAKETVALIGEGMKLFLLFILSILLILLVYFWPLLVLIIVVGAIAWCRRRLPSRSADEQHSDSTHD